MPTIMFFTHVSNCSLFASCWPANLSDRRWYLRSNFSRYLLRQKSSAARALEVESNGGSNATETGEGGEEGAFGEIGEAGASGCAGRANRTGFGASCGRSCG